MVSALRSTFLGYFTVWVILLLLALSYGRRQVELERDLQALRKGSSPREVRHDRP